MAVTALTDANFDSVIKEQGYVLVDFWAEWCGPCMQLAPIIEELAEEVKDTVLICKMNIDANTEIPSQLAIRSIPTMILFKNGKRIDTKIGSLPKNALKAWLDLRVNV